MSKDPGYSDSKRDALESKVRQYQSTILELQEQVLVLGKLKAENTKLRECAEFYANEYNYDIVDYFGISGEIRFRCVLNKDMEERNDVYKYAGKRARQVLKELDENK